MDDAIRKIVYELYPRLYLRLCRQSRRTTMQNPYRYAVIIFD